MALTATRNGSRKRTVRGFPTSRAVRSTIRGPLHSEREWISLIQSAPPEPVAHYLHLELTRANITHLEEQSCGEIVRELDSRARAVLDKLPSFPELAQDYSESRNTRLYSVVDLRRLWLQRFHERHPTELDSSLLHYHFGRSRKPPRLWTLDSLRTAV